jgi:hypothetical protein
MSSIDKLKSSIKDFTIGTLNPTRVILEYNSTERALNVKTLLEDSNIPLSITDSSVGNALLFDLVGISSKEFIPLLKDFLEENNFTFYHFGE